MVNFEWILVSIILACVYGILYQYFFLFSTICKVLSKGWSFPDPKVPIDGENKWVADKNEHRFTAIKLTGAYATDVL